MNKVQVLMSTYNGEKYVEEQINSIFNQKDIEIQLIVRDDGSTDNTINILSKLSSKYPIQLIRGENVGAKQSFLELIKKAGNCEYYAFADQDDFWLEDKLIKAVLKLEKENYKIPKMYHSNLYVVNECLKNPKYMFKDLKSLGFAEALAHNNVVGCTMVFNDELLKIIQENMINELPCYHDQWISLICSLYGGIKIADNDAYILYRQHANNAVGAKDNIILKIKRKSYSRGKGKRYKIACNLYDLFKNTKKDDLKAINELVEIINYKTNIIYKFGFIRRQYQSRNIKIAFKTTIAILLNRF